MDDLLHIAICEDNQKDMERLYSCIMESNIGLSCREFLSGEDFLEDFSPGKYDVIFLDIYMGGIKGIDVAREIRKADQTVTIIFTTTSTEYTLESYRLRAASYLEKPVSQEDVQGILSLALAKRRTESYISLMIDGANRALPLDRILYFELQNHAVMIYTHSEVLRTSQSVKIDHIDSLLPAHFFRCHHSYIVNLGYVKEIDRDMAIFIMQDNSRVHIRRRDLKRAVRAYEDFLFTKTRGESI
ncbi:MAG: LytTR family DNA-binding domain-containing protein [Tissierellaceae bacterium]